MNTRVALVLGVSLGLLTGLASSCGAGPCNANTCLGCCDAAGECQTGLEVDACGLDGAACSLCAADQACQAGTCAANSLVLTVSINPDPPHTGSNSLTVAIVDVSGAAVLGASVQVAYMMPTMPGMGTGHATGVEQGNGIYTVSGVNFSMGGGWKVTVTATQGALSATRVLTYSL